MSCYGHQRYKKIYTFSYKEMLRAKKCSSRIALTPIMVTFSFLFLLVS